MPHPQSAICDPASMAWEKTAFHGLVERAPHEAPRGAEANLLKGIYQSVAAVDRGRLPEVHPMSQFLEEA
jgi:hypothetical protein